MKALKYVLAAVAALAVLVAAGVAYFAATFDPNAYKPQIIALVKEKTQRTLRLDGDIRLAFWPSIGAEVGRMSLSEPNSDKPFAAMESARVSLKVIPLLSRNYVVDELTIKGLRASIVRGKGGATNVDDLLGKEEPKESKPQQQVKFDIAHVALDNADVEYRDDTTGARYALSGLTLKTGRITPDVPTKIELKTTARSNQPKLDVTLDGKTTATFNLERQSYKLEGLSLEVKGQAADLTNLDAKAAGTVSANLKSNEFSADKLTVGGTGMRGKEKLRAKLDAPKLVMTTDKATGDKILFTLGIAAPEGTTTLNASLPTIEGTARSFRSPAMSIDLDRKQRDQTVKAKIASPLTGSVEGKQFALPQLRASVTITAPKLPGGSAMGELAGSASVDGAKQRAQADIAGKIADSTMKARVAVAHFSPLALDFDVDVDQIDLDRYASSPAKAKSGDKPPAGKAPPKGAEEPMDLTALRDIRANGALRVGALKTTNIRASRVRVDVKANGGRVDLNPVSANLYDGALSGSVSINAAPATPAFAVKQTLTGVQVGPLLRDLAETDTLEGKGNVSVNITTQGNTVSALKKALNGSAAVKLNDGAIKGIDIAGSIRKAQGMLTNLKGQATQQQSDTRQRTDFSELTATFDISNGVARNNDLSVKSPLLRIGGAGSVNIGEDTLDYTVKASLVATTAGQGGKERTDLRGITVPVHVSGPFTSPSYRLDFGAMVTDTARQKIEETVTKKLEERLGGRAGSSDAPKDTGSPGRKAIEDSLRGLFGR
ncbi:MAG: AsmA family protein [Rhodospirillaceae bacterium]